MHGTKGASSEVTIAASPILRTLVYKDNIRRAIFSCREGRREASIATTNDKDVAGRREGIHASGRNYSNRCDSK